MKTRIRPEQWILILGILLCAQLFFYCLTEYQAIKKIQARTLAFKSQIFTLSSQKRTAEIEVKRLNAVVADLKPWLNTGFSDPESGLVKFLDFVNPALLSRVNAKVVMRSKPELQNAPIPLQKTQFQLSLEFLYPSEIEQFLSELFLQHHYPLNVISASIKRVPHARTRANIDMELLLPSSLLNLTNKDLATPGA
jgi:hypothetical protein